MKNKGLYQETFSQLHSSREIRWEDYENMEISGMRRRRRPVRRLALLAAALVLLAALSGMAWAADLFGLRELLLPPGAQTQTDVLDGDGVPVPGVTEPAFDLSLSGYMDYPESRALAEWQEFLTGYDPDGEIIARIGNEPTGFEEQYGLYFVYTQEMADRLEEIAAKYDLRLHTDMEIVLPGWWPLAVGDFLGENNIAWTGYIYEDGTFRYDGDVILDGYGRLEYQFSRSVRGSFQDVVLNVGDVSQFEEWQYHTASGVMVTLGLGDSRSLLVTDLGDCFIFVNVLSGRGGDNTFSSGGITAAELEAFADSFDFASLTPVVTPDLPGIAAAVASELG